MHRNAPKRTDFEAVGLIRARKPVIAMNILGSSSQQSTAPHNARLTPDRINVMSKRRDQNSHRLDGR